MTSSATSKSSSSSRTDRQHPVLLFMHIPKTAGTSLRFALEQVFEPDERAYLYPSADLDGAINPRDFPRLPEEERDRPRLIMGHFGYGIHAAVPGPSRYVTILRDPVDRVISLYYHYQALAAPREGSAGAEERQRIAEQGLGLDDWVFGRQQQAVDNGMVRQIVGYPRLRFGACPDSLVTEALAHIQESFDAVLIRGRMAQGMEIIGKLVGSPLPRLTRENANPARPLAADIDPRLRRRIRELNRLDDRLFRLMVERFPDTYERVMHLRRPT